MSVSIKSISSASPDEWDSTWWECPYSTYFHSREWAEVWNVYTEGRMRPEPKLVMFSDGKRALIPLSSKRSYKGLVKSYISSPAYTFGGWISRDELDVAHAALLVNYLTEKLGNLYWRLNPYDELVFKAGVRTSRDDETHVLNLAGGFETILHKWTKRQNSANQEYKARKARREGVSVRLASTLDDWLSYYQIYENTLRRWGDNASSAYGWGIFDELFRRNSPHIQLWLAVYQDEIVSGAINFYARKHAVGWHNSALAEYFNLRPVNLLVYEIVKDACERGFSWFDLNPSGGHEGVKAFKKSFSAEGLASPEVKIETDTLAVVKRVRGVIGKVG